MIYHKHKGLGLVLHPQHSPRREYIVKRLNKDGGQWLGVVSRSAPGMKWIATDNTDRKTRHETREAAISALLGRYGGGDP